MKGVRSLCIICSLDFTNGVNEEEENKLPSLFAKIWKVFCHHFNVSTSSSSKSKYDEIFNYFFSVSELPFCNNCRNDVAELLILHEKCQKVQERIKRVKTRISVTIVNSSKTVMSKSSTNCNEDAQNKVKLEALENSKDYSKNESEKLNDSSSIFDQVLCNEQVNQLILLMRLNIVQNYNPRVVLLDVNGQSRDNNRKTSNHKIASKSSMQDAHTQYDLDIGEDDDSFPISISNNQDSQSSRVLTSSCNVEEDEENLPTSLLNFKPLNEIKLEMGSTNTDDSSCPNANEVGKKLENSIPMEEEPPQASTLRHLGDFHNVRISVKGGDETPSKFSLPRPPPPSNAFFEIISPMEEEDEQEEQECDPLALDINPDPDLGQLDTRIKEEPAQEYNIFPPLSQHQNTFEVPNSTIIPASQQQPVLSNPPGQLSSRKRQRKQNLLVSQGLLRNLLSLSTTTAIYTNNIPPPPPVFPLACRSSTTLKVPRSPAVSGKLTTTRTTTTTTTATINRRKYARQREKDTSQLRRNTERLRLETLGKLLPCYKHLCRLQPKEKPIPPKIKILSEARAYIETLKTQERSLEFQEKSLKMRNAVLKTRVQVLTAEQSYREAHDS